MVGGAVLIWYCWGFRGSPYLVLLGVSGQSIFGLPGGLVQSIFGSGGWFGAVHNLYCQVVRCSPYLVLLGGSVQSIFGTALGGLAQSIFGIARWFVAVHVWYCQVIWYSPFWVYNAEWFFTAVCGVLQFSVNWYTAVWFVAVHIWGIAVWFLIHPVWSWYGCMVWDNPYLVLSVGLLQSSAGQFCCSP